MSSPRVFISADMEGVAGVVDWDQCRRGASSYDEGCRLLLGEVNAAVLGALDAGAGEVVVCDSHGAMANLPPDSLDGGASYVSGRLRLDYMMSGLDASFAAIMFIGYHGSLPTPSVLSHTFNPSVVSDARIGGVRAAESGINALVAAEFRVPVVLVSGDQYVGPEAAPFCPGIAAVEVKRSLNRTSAVSRHPDEARALIRAGSAEAVRRCLDSQEVAESANPANGSTAEPANGQPGEQGATGAAPIASPPVHVGDLEVDLFTTDMAEVAATVRGVERIAERTVMIEVGDAPRAAYRSFVAMIIATRGLSAS